MPKEDQIKAIKKGFQKEILRWHPDNNFGDDENAKEIILAYEILKDEEKKARYHNEADYDSAYGWVSLKRWKTIFKPECVTEKQKESYKHRWIIFFFVICLFFILLQTRYNTQKTRITNFSLQLIYKVPEGNKEKKTKVTIYKTLLGVSYLKTGNSTYNKLLTRTYLQNEKVLQNKKHRRPTKCSK